MSSLNPEQLENAYDAIITEQSTTFAKESPRYSNAELKQAVRDIRSATRETASSLPASAFENQPDDSDGNEVWSAGELISHLSSSFWSIGGRALDIAELDNPGPGDALSAFGGQTPRVLTQDESFEALDAGDEAAEVLFGLIPDDVDLSVSADTDFFGEMSARSWLMFISVHEADHVRQLATLKDV